MRELLVVSDECCPSCTHQLRQLTGTACPECGELLVLRVGREHPNLAAYLVGLIGLIIPVGFSGIVLILMMTTEFVAAMAVLITFIITLAFGSLLLGWIMLGRRIRRQSPTVRVLLAAACWLAPLVLIGTLFLIILLSSW